MKNKILKLQSPRIKLEIKIFGIGVKPGTTIWHNIECVAFHFSESLHPTVQHKKSKSYSKII